MLQQIQYQTTKLMMSKLSIKDLAALQTISKGVEERQCFEEVEKFKDLIQLVKTTNFQQNSVDCFVVMRIEKCVQRFHSNISVIMKTLVAIWQNIKLGNTREEKLLEQLQVITQMQAQCQKVVQMWRNHKAMKLQQMILKYILSITNIKGQSGPRDKSE